MCFYGRSGGSADGSGGLFLVMVAVGVVVLVIVVRVLRVFGVGMVEGVGLLNIRAVEVDCTGVCWVRFLWWRWCK